MNIIVTLTDQAYFQLQIGPLDHPGTWSVRKRNHVAKN